MRRAASLTVAAAAARRTATVAPVTGTRSPTRTWLSTSTTTPTTTTTTTTTDTTDTGDVNELIHRVAKTAATPVSLQQLHHFGKIASKDPKQRIRNAAFLHGELQIRIAQRVVELERLPLDMCQTKGVKQVVQWFTEYFELLNKSPYPTDEKGEEAFTQTLRMVLQDHNQVVETMARGALEVKARPDFNSAWQKTVDAVLSRFFMARIGLRFLIEHHIQSREHHDGFAGIIQSHCAPIECLEKAALDVSAICTHHLGESPEVQFLQVKRDGTRLRGGASANTQNITFTYVPGHVVYMATEVLKNAARATVEEHAKRGASLPPVKVVIVEGANDIAIRISDEGGGIRRKDLGSVWSYLHTTAASPPDLSTAAAESASAAMAETNMPALAGYGVGLPLSRLYAKYFGGDLALKSLDGFGTDVYIHLSRLGHDCEQLPETVLYSPAERDSTLPRGMSTTSFS